MTLDKIEVGWGGLPRDFDASISFCACYAHSASFPTTPSLVINLFANSTTGTQHKCVLWDTDIHLGSSGDGSFLTPITYFWKNPPWNLLFLEDTPHACADIPQLLHFCTTTWEPCALALFVEQWDYTFDGTRDRAALVATNPSDAWCNTPGTLKHVLAMPHPNPTIANVATCFSAAIACLSGPRTQPSPLSISCILEWYGDWSDTPISAFSQTTLKLMAVEHTPYRPCIHGFPWHHDLSPLILCCLWASNIADPLCA